MQIGPNPLEVRELLATFKFKAGQLVKHGKTGGTYVILGACYIEKDLKPAYLYSPSQASVMYCRPQSEMEDGRFKLVSTEGPRSSLSNFLDCAE